MYVCCIEDLYSVITVWCGTIYDWFCYYMLLLLYSVHLLLYPAVSYFLATFTMIVYIRNLCELTKIPVKSQSFEKNPKAVPKTLLLWISRTEGAGISMEFIPWRIRSLLKYLFKMVHFNLSSILVLSYNVLISFFLNIEPNCIESICDFVVHTCKLLYKRLFLT